MSGVVEYENIQDALLKADSVTICFSQNEYMVEGGNSQYESLMDFVERLLEDSHQVPALGVAIHSEVIEEKKNKNWIEFHYVKKCVCNEMPFDSLLIFLEKDMGGVNIFRCNNGEYKGRCFYVNLNSQLPDIFNFFM